MTAYTPSYKVIIDGVEVTDITIANLIVTSGRTDINAQPIAGYCQMQLMNLDNSNYNFTVGARLGVQVTDSNGDYVSIFGGYISDFTVGINQAGSIGFTTVATITALGALSRLPRIIDPAVLSVDFDGDQIYTLLSQYLLGQWFEVPATETWATYDPTETWNDAANIGLGQIDQPGAYELIARTAEETDLYSICAAIANSAFGVLFEDAEGNIGYADQTHRQDYLAANGYTTLDANHANGFGLASTTRAGDIRNKYVLNYGSTGSSQYIAQDLDSQSLYGVYAEQFISRINTTLDAEALADRYIALRATPYSKFQAITFVLGNPEIDDADRDALVNIFLGQPVWIQNLPGNINLGSFQGYIEGWTFRASLNNLSVTFNASPINFSQLTVKWEQVDPVETWNTLSPSLTWLEAIGAVA
jgi:hypothetical protein